MLALSPILSAPQWRNEIQHVPPPLPSAPDPPPPRSLLLQSRSHPLSHYPRVALCLTLSHRLRQSLLPSISPSLPLSLLLSVPPPLYLPLSLSLSLRVSPSLPLPSEVPPYLPALLPLHLFLTHALRRGGHARHRGAAGRQKRPGERRRHSLTRTGRRRRRRRSSAPISPPQARPAAAFPSGPLDGQGVEPRLAEARRSQRSRNRRLPRRGNRLGAESRGAEIGASRLAPHALRLSYTAYSTPRCRLRRRPADRSCN
jgi:hypothetical protein